MHILCSVCAQVLVHWGVAWPGEGISSRAAALFPSPLLPPRLPLSMEVGVCVEAYRQEAETQRRHINSAFMTFVVLDADDQPRKLPWIQPQPGVSGGGAPCCPTPPLLSLLKGIWE